jgi:hypothetical protein
MNLLLYRRWKQFSARSSFNILSPLSLRKNTLCPLSLWKNPLCPLSLWERVRVRVRMKARVRTIKRYFLSKNSGWIFIRRCFSFQAKQLLMR